MKLTSLKAVAGFGIAVALIGAIVFYNNTSRRAEKPAGGVPVSSASGDVKSSAATNAVQKTQKHAHPESLPGAHPQPEAPKDVANQALTSDPKKAVVSADQAAALVMRDKLDNEDTAGALAMARKLMHASDPEVRAEVVSVLGWIGLKAFPELLALASDADPDVAQDAYEQALQAITESEDDAWVASSLEKLAQSQQDQDRAEEVLMHFDQLPVETALPHIVALVNSSNPVVSELARGVYEEMTGDAYSTLEAAQKAIEAAVKDAAQ